ncbi:hypothetical protein JTE90_000725 [Oedothorax gibbosus]|uniref:ELMO domain-containing protein n=1 Tax=Oedothorax gibbosus TaxID=931172 RepID=A0AAV6UPU7_9ARAC|nr:hypothetical protein JTE90_000725 [Oedothorax gibbosus]
MFMIVSSWCSSIFSYILSLKIVKGFLRRILKDCELQRICYGEESGFNRSSKIENSLIQSRNSEIKKMLEQLNNQATQGRFIGKSMKNCVEYAIKATIIVKNINHVFHKKFVISYRRCLYQIFGYKQLLHEIENLRKTPYSSENEEHEEKLLNLWNLLKPDTPLESRVSKQWGDIGFQGDDPKTDFRGMGLLGLENLLYFATEHCEVAKHVLLHSSHPKYGYSFAIVGINLTSMAYHMLKDQKLKVHFYNFVQNEPSIKDFHYVYSYLFCEFDKLWLAEKPRDIMEFSRIRTKFEEQILKRLENPYAKLRLSSLTQIL